MNLCGDDGGDGDGDDDAPFACPSCAVLRATDCVPLSPACYWKPATASHGCPHLTADCCYQCCPCWHSL